MGTNHPNPGMTRMKMVEQTHDLVRQLGLLNKSVFFGDWIPYDRRGSVLSAATIGISTHFPHLETHFSYGHGFWTSYGRGCRLSVPRVIISLIWRATRTLE